MLKRFSLGLWFLCLLLLAIRPYVPSLYALGYGSDIGAFNMYTERGRAEVNGWINGRPVDLQRYRWHGWFGSGARAHVYPGAIEALAKFVAAREPCGAEVRVELRLWRGGKLDTREAQAVRPC